MNKYLIDDSEIYTAKVKNLRQVMSWIEIAAVIGSMILLSVVITVHLANLYA